MLAIKLSNLKAAVRIDKKNIACTVMYVSWSLLDGVGTNQSYTSVLYNVHMKSKQIMHTNNTHNHGCAALNIPDDKAYKCHNNMQPRT